MLIHPNILLLSDNEKDIAELQQLLQEHAVLTLARNLTKMLYHLVGSTYDSLLCAWSIQGGRWKDALDLSRRLDPDLPVIIFSPTGGQREWTEVLDAGAFDLVVAPYAQHVVLSTLQQAGAAHEAWSRHNSSRRRKAS